MLRFPSSYVYVKSNTTVKANVAEGGAVVVSFSDNNGLDWKPVATVDKSGEQNLDLTKLTARRYDYRLKFELKGAGTKVESIKSVNDFQCSQAALPVIAEGENKLTFAAGPQEGTVTIEGGTDVSTAQKNQQLTVSDFHPVLDSVNERLRMTAGKGSATFNVATPGEIMRLRISAGWRARDAVKDGWEIEASYDGGKTFKTIGTLAGGVKGESGYIIASDLPAGTKAAQVRLAGKQANTTLLFDLRIDADYKEPAGGFKPVKITYNWEESGQAKSHTHVAAKESDAYSITCGPQTVVKSYTMELAE